MTTLYLIRHAASDSVGRYIAGRTSGVHLNDVGRTQAERLAERFAGLTLNAIYSSPLERARETAEPLARRTGAPLELREELLELDFGEWTGMSFTDLAADDRWRRFNTIRSRTRIPGGELMSEAQTRGVSMAESIRELLPDGRVAIVTHGDVLRGIIAHYLGIPVDLMQRFEVAPASMSVLQLGPEHVLLERLNLVDGPPINQPSVAVAANETS